MAKKNKKNNIKIDWNIHAVYDPDDPNAPVDMHTHGLEKHNIHNICMSCPSRDQEMINFCGNFINNLARNMINGDKYKVGITHLHDNAEDWMEVYDVFDLNIEKRDNGNGEEDVYVVDYWFDDIFLNPNNMLHYVFNHNTKEWNILTKEEYNAMSKDEYERRMKKNRHIM